MESTWDADRTKMHHSVCLQILDHIYFKSTFISGEWYLFKVLLGFVEGILA